MSSYRELAEQMARMRSDESLGDLLHNGTETSREAAESVRNKSALDRQRILDSLVAFGPQTRAELVKSTGLCENSLNARCFELVSKLGLAHEDGKRDGRAVIHFGPQQQAAA